MLNTVIANTVFEQRVQHSKRYRPGHGIKEVDVHSNCCLWLLCGTLLPFAGNNPMAAFASKQEQPSADYPGFKAFQTFPSTIATNDWISSYIF